LQLTLLTGLGFLLVLEGLMPLLAPQTWRETFRRIMELKDGQLRFVGLMSVLTGLVLIFLSK